jgi:hypothetical protein
MNESLNNQAVKPSNTKTRLIRIGLSILFLLTGVTGCTVMPAEEDAVPSEVLVDICPTDRNLTGYICNISLRPYFIG